MAPIPLNPSKAFRASIFDRLILERQLHCRCVIYVNFSIFLSFFRYSITFIHTKSTTPYSMWMHVLVKVEGQKHWKIPTANQINRWICHIRLLEILCLINNWKLYPLNHWMNLTHPKTPNLKNKLNFHYLLQYIYVPDYQTTKGASLIM